MYTYRWLKRHASILIEFVKSACESSCIIVVQREGVEDVFKKCGEVFKVIHKQSH